LISHTAYAARKGKRSWKRVFRVFLSTLLIGVTIAAPVGAISILYYRRALVEGWRAGMATVLGAATADALFATAAAFSLSAFTAILISLQTPVRVIGGLFLIYLGVKALRAVPQADHTLSTVTERGTLWRYYVSTLLLTLTNPLTILLFTGVFAGMGAAATLNESCPPALVAGIFSGSLLWAGGCVLVLTALRSRLRHGIPPWVMRAINIVSGIALIAFALSSLLTVLIEG
jgi:threonine/homoserine/homoserine lactone efflux protein